MKRYLCLIGAMLAAAATPALASEARPSGPTAHVAAQRTADHQSFMPSPWLSEKAGPATEREVGLR